MNWVQTGHRKQAGPADGELVPGLSGLCADGCPSQLFGWPSSLPPMDDLQGPDSAGCCPSVPAEPQSCLQGVHWSPAASCHAARCHPEPCLYQLNMHGGHFLAAEDGGSSASSRGLQVEFRLSPSASPPLPATLLSPFHTFSSLLRTPPVQHPRSLTQ